MTSTYSDDVCSKFRATVTSSYELDNDVVNNLCDFVKKALSEVSPPSTVAKRSAKVSAKVPEVQDQAGAGVTAVVKKPRNKSGYNCYVQKMMVDDKVKNLKHTEKMAEIGRCWKLLSDEEKNVFKTLAVSLNASDETVSQATTTTTTAVATA